MFVTSDPVKIVDDCDCRSSTSAGRMTPNDDEPVSDMDIMRYAALRRMRYY